MLEKLQTLEQDIRTDLELGNADLETVEEIEAEFRDHAGIIARIHRDEPFKRYLQEYVRREHRRYVSAGGGRNRPLCRCSYPECDLKRGVLPARIGRADSMQTGIDEFQAVHPQAEVLLDARGEWVEMVATYRSLLRKAKYKLADSARIEV